MLHPGLYEQVINNALNRELAKIPEARKSIAPIDTAEAAVVVKATAGFAVCRLILKSLLFYSCLDFTQNLGKT